MQNLGSPQLRNAAKQAPIAGAAAGATAGAGPLHITLGPTQVKAGAGETTSHPTPPLFHRAWRRPAWEADCPGQGLLKMAFGKKRFILKNTTSIRI